MSHCAPRSACTIHTPLLVRGSCLQETCWGECVNSPDLFCYVCRVYTEEKWVAIRRVIKQTYEFSFSLFPVWKSAVADQDKRFAPHSCEFQHGCKDKGDIYAVLACSMEGTFERSHDFFFLRKPTHFFFKCSVYCNAFSYKTGAPTS